MRKFHTLKIAEIRRETPEAVSIRFDVPEDLWEQYAYKQGQHLTLKAQIDGAEVRRNYSICAGVADRELRIAVKQVNGGRFSSFANQQLKAGDSIDVFPPTGHFYTDLDPAAEKRYVAFSGGSGITPILSIIKSTLAAEPHSSFTLLYGNRSPASVIFLEELAALKNRYMNRFEVYHFLESEADEIDLFSGRLDRTKCAELFKTMIKTADIDAFFICGPGPMMDAVETALHEDGVPQERILIERFISADDATQPLPPQRQAANEDAAAQAELVVILDGRQRSFGFGPNQRSILNAAIAAGLDVPFACKGGVCCTCRAKVLEGDAKMMINYGLTDEEVAAGYVLTCQSAPVSKKLVLSYDD